MLTASSLNYSPKPILENINEVLGFGWIHICVIELTSAIIELFWASLNCTTASLNQTVVSSDMQLLNSTGSALCFKNSMPLETLWDYTGRGCSITDFMDRFHTPTVVGKYEYKNVIIINIYICKRILYPDLTVFARNMFLGSLLPNVALWQPINLSSCTWGQRNDS